MKVDASSLSLKTTMDFVFIFILLFSILVECRPQGYYENFGDETEKSIFSDGCSKYESQGKLLEEFYKTLKDDDCVTSELCKELNRRDCTGESQCPQRCGHCLRDYAPDSEGICGPSKNSQAQVGSPVAQDRPVVADRDVESLNQIEKQIDDVAQSGPTEKGAVKDNTTPETTEPPATTTTKIHEHPVLPQKHVKGPVKEMTFNESTPYRSDFIFIVITAACSVVGLVGLIFAGVCWYKLQKNVKAASEVEYPAYGVTGPNKERVVSPDDRKLAQSAQMYHYQRQKQQMIALERANGEMKHDGSDEESDVENEEGDYTVYECPGLAPTGEMEVKNPLFNEDVPPSPPQDGSGPR